MKRNPFKKVIAAMLGGVMALGVGIAVGVKSATNKEAVPVSAATSSYEKATSIAVGDTVTLVYEAGKKELGGISTTSTKYGLSTSYTTLPAGVFALTVENGSSSGTFAFKNGDNYLNWSSKNSLSTATTISDNTSWTVSIANGNATITNVKQNTRVIKYNTSDPRFACYESGQQAIQIYKLVTVEEGAVTGVSLDKSFEPVKLGSTLSLTATIAPSDATNKNISWSSSDTSVATVANGVVTPVAKGNSTITVTTEDGGKTASCVVIVTDHAGTSADPLSTSDAVLVQAAANGTTPSKFYVTGDVTEISITAGGSCSGKITDGTTEISLYTIYDEGDSSSSKFSDTGKIIVSDTIVVYSVIGKYYSTVQVQYGNLYSVTRNVTLNSVEIRGSVTNTQYVNENWDVTELTVYAIYSNDEIDVTSQVDLICNPEKPTTSGSQSFTVDVTYSGVAATQRTFTVNVSKAVATITDVLTAEDLEATGNTYVEFSNVTKTSKAVYAGQSAKDSSGNIQLRSKNSNSGIVTTSRGGKRIKSVSIEVGSGTPSVQVYGSNTAYEGTDASVLYGNSAGDLVATLSKTSTSVSFQDDYKFVGIRSEKNAIYLSSITIEWELYTSEEVASSIKTMAGGWSNDTSTSSCGDHYKEAKEMVLLMSASDLSEFQSATTGDIASARQTYEWWCHVNGDATPYSGAIVQNASAKVLANLFNADKGSTAAIIAVASLVSVAAIGGYFFLKKKKA